MKNINILGLESGVGMMLLPFYQKGCNILGAADTRKFAHSGTFQLNFKNDNFFKNFDDVPNYENVDVIVSQPKCGTFSGLSRLRNKEKDHHEKLLENNLKKIDAIFNKVESLKPKFFILENVPKLKERLDLENLKERFSQDYNMDFFIINNYDYGNLQFTRKRFFIIFSKKELNYSFKPIENPISEENHKTLGELLKGVENLSNYNTYEEDKPFLKLDSNSYKLTYREYKEFIKNEHFPTRGYNKRVFKKIKSGRLMQLPGTGVIDDNVKTVFTVIWPYYLLRSSNHNFRALSLREYARIMGYPDDFIFKGGEHLIGRQIISAPCYEFMNFLATQVINTLKDKENI